MKFIELTHNHFGHKILIAVDKLNSVQRRYDKNTGEARTLVTYGINDGHYVREEADEIMKMIDGEIIKPIDYGEE